MPSTPRRFRLATFSLALNLSALALATTACRDQRAPTAEGSNPTVAGPAGPLGETGNDKALQAAVANADTMATAFSLAHHVLYGDEKPDTTVLAELPGRRAFVCAYGNAKRSACGTGAGDNLAASIDAAAAELKRASGFSTDARAQQRLKIDVVTSANARSFDGDVHKMKSRDVGLDGVWVQTGTGNQTQSAYVLPSEVLEQGMFGGKKRNKGLRRDAVDNALEHRNDDLDELGKSFTFDEIRTVSWVERDQPPAGEPGIARLYRTHKWEFESVDPDRLLQFSVWAGDYLISSVSSDGAIRYQYFVTRDNDSRSYNWLRHGGTTYSMLQLYDRTKFAPYLLASEQAIEKLMTRSEVGEREGPYGGGKVMFVVSPSGRGKYTPDGKRIKLGGAGLALLALATHAEATGDRERYLEQARSFARFIVASQRQSGEFIYFPPYKADDPVDPEDSLYYPGEAMLGLMKLYAFDRNPMWVDTVRRAADWLIDVRDKGKTHKSLANDHWLMIALSYLYMYTEDKKYLDHSLALARAVEYQYQKRVADAEHYKDFLGGYYDPPRSTPAATRGEGLVAVLDSCDVAKMDCAWVEKILHDTIRHEMLSMYQPDLMYWIPNKAKAFGAFNGGLIDMSIRNDFVQHNMSAVLGYERHLRKKNGVTLPGGPQWTEARAKGQASFDGLADDAMGKLREATVRYRGQDAWTKRAAQAKQAAEMPEPATDTATDAAPTDAAAPTTEPPTSASDAKPDGTEAGKPAPATTPRRHPVHENINLQPGG